MIREAITRLHSPVEPGLLYRYSVVSARWEALRVLIHKGGSTPTDDRRFRELGNLLRTLSQKLGLPAATEDSAYGDDIVGITAYGGYLPFDMSYLLPDESWQAAAEGWQRNAPIRSP